MNDERHSPKLYIWKNSRLFIGINHLPFRKYTLAWSQLLVSIKGVMRIQLEDGTEVLTKTCMIKAGTIVNEEHINTRDAVIAIYYFNPISQEFYILQQQMLTATKDVCYRHPTERELIHELQHILKQPLLADDAYLLIQELIVPSHLRSNIIKDFDPRIIETVQKIRESYRDNLSVSDYAQHVHLSESRINKLFKEQIGIPITKYRLQLRLSVGIILLGAGYSVTDAAYGAGFANTAHFSRCFSAMIGVQPSITFLKPPFVNAFICNKVLNAVVSDIG